MATQLGNAKEALAQIGARSTITALNDGSPEANYINLLYNPIRDFLLTEGDYDWALLSTALTALTVPTFPWVAAYSYPSGGLRIRQIIPFAANPLDPKPIQWLVAGTGGARTIYTSDVASTAFYTAPVAEALWDGIFQQSFVRMLASALSFALENRIEASKVKLDEALGFAGIGKIRDM